MKGTFHFYHHAAFSISAQGETALFDPFLDGNPEGLSAKDIKADWIFVSHGHHDHLGSAFEIAKACSATIISTAEMCGLAKQSDCKAHAMHIGGTHEFPFGKVRIAPAFHGAGVPGGHACGFIVDFHGIRLYFAGDTSVYGDMALLQRLDPFDIAILPIGDNFTMGPEDAALAADFLKAPKVIPVHYNTWPIIEQDPMVFKRLVENTTDSEVVIVSPGQTIEI